MIIAGHTKCRINTVADIFSALVNPRLYHREKSVHDALEFIGTFNCAGQDLVQRLHRLVRPEERWQGGARRMPNRTVRGGRHM